MRTCPTCSSHNDGMSDRCHACGQSLDSRRSTPQLTGGDLTVEKKNLPSARDSAREPGRIQLLARLLDELQSGASGIEAASPDVASAPSRQQPTTIGKYDVLGIVGSGGFGDVYHCRDPELDRSVAIKVLHLRQGTLNVTDQTLSSSEHGGHVEALRREARVLAELDHPNICPIYAFDLTDDGTPYVVSKYVDGCRLSDRIASGDLDAREAIEIAAKVAAGLHHAHIRRLVHRDIKPANILLQTDGRPVIVDFGLALTDTDYGDIMVVQGGSPPYMSPEQAEFRGHLADSRTDIFSLGVVLYQMLTGELPFRGETNSEVLEQVRCGDPRPIRMLAPDTAVPLEEVCLKALAKRPENRFRTAQDFADALWAVHKLFPGHLVPDRVYQSICPYRGLRPFSFEQKEFFFGRSALTARLIEHIRRFQEGNASSKLLAIVGPSGIGKSSVAQAGLLPAIREGRLPGSENWTVLRCRPGANPIDSLAITFASHLQMEVGDARQLADEMRVDSKGLSLAVSMALQRSSEDSAFLLFVDQFEELFTLCRDPVTRGAAIDNLMYAVSNPSDRLVVVVTVRADMYGHCAAYPELARALTRHQELVGPLNEAENREAIEAPAARVGLHLEPGLVDLLLRDIDQQPGALPLMQYALALLWEAREGDRLTVEAYRRLGGVANALEQRANHEYQQFDEQQKQICQQLFLRLFQPHAESDSGHRQEATNPDHDLLPLQRRVVRHELPDNAATDQVINQLANARLITTVQSDSNSESYVEVSHEALAYWSKVRDWLRHDRRWARFLHELIHDAGQWRSSGRDASYLYRGRRLREARKWIRARNRDVAHSEREFVAAARRSARVRLWAGLCAAGLVAAVVAALPRSTEPRGETEKAQIETLVAEANSDIARHPQLAVKKLLQADQKRRDNGFPDEFAIEETFRTAVAQIGGRSIPGTRTTTCLAISRDDQWLVTGDAHGARLWGTGAGHPICVGTLADHSGAVKAVDMWTNQEVTRLVTVTSEGRVRMWDWQRDRPNLAEFVEFGQHDARSNGFVCDARFSLDGRWLATSDQRDSVVRVYDLREGDHRHPARQLSPPEPTQHYKQVTFDASGSMIAGLRWDGPVRIWTLEESQKSKLLPRGDGNNPVVDLVSHPQLPHTLLLGHKDGTVRQFKFDLDTLAAEDELIVKAGVEVTGLSIDPEARWLITTHTDGKARRWDAGGWTEEREPRVFSGHGGAIIASATSRSYLLTVAGHHDSQLSGQDHDVDATVRIWGVEVPMCEAEPMRLRIARPPARRGEASISPYTTICIDPKQRWLIASCGSPNRDRYYLRLWDWQQLTQPEPSVASITSPQLCSPREFYFGSLCVDASGKWVVGCSGKWAYKWSLDELGQGELTDPSRFSGPPEGSVTRLARGGEWLFAVDSPHAGQLYRYSLVDTEAEPILVREANDLDLTTSQPEFLVSGSSTGSVQLDRLVYPSDGSPARLQTEWKTDVVGWEIHNVAVSRDGLRVVAIDEREQVYVWDWQTSPVGRTFGHDAARVHAVALSADGRWLALADSGNAVGHQVQHRVVVWDLSAEQPHAKVLGTHNNAVHSIAITPNGSHVVSASADDDIRFWHNDFEELCRPRTAVSPATMR